MDIPDRSKPRPLLLLIAGAKGAVASTLAVAIAVMRKNPDDVLPNLTTRNMFSYLAPAEKTKIAGWDASPKTLSANVEAHGVIPESIWKHHGTDLDQLPLHKPPPASLDLRSQVEHVMEDIQLFKDQYPEMLPVFINLLPAGVQKNLGRCKSLSKLYSQIESEPLPDLAYTLAAILSSVPVVNFTPNEVEILPIVNESIKRRVPISGRDGKTGQTYLKVVLASALKARNLIVDGWYSLNILGNADGKNLMNPEKAAGKVAHKTEILDDILDYRVGQRYGVSSHKVHIDYYPPRGDAKEAWDVIDFTGMFGLPMSIRLNLQGRDSILAAPLVLDLGRWMAALQMAGRHGLIAELGFYYKKPVGDDPPLTFQEQIKSLLSLEQTCNEKVASKS